MCNVFKYPSSGTNNRKCANKSCRCKLTDNFKGVYKELKTAANQEFMKAKERLGTIYC